MNTLADANTLAVLMSFLSFSGALATTLGWNQNLRPIEVNAVKYNIYAMTLLSLGLIVFLVAMYSHLQNEPAYPYGFAPTAGQITLAAILVSLHFCNLMWMWLAYNHHVDTTRSERRYGRV